MNGAKSTSSEQPELLSAPTQQALQEILAESQSQDVITRLWAFDRFTRVFKKLVGPDPAESTMHAAAKLLEKGFLRPIAEGLKECVDDPMKLVVGGDSPDDSDVLLIQSEVCIKALECLALDSRAVRCILQEFPSLPAVLKMLFLEELTPAERALCPVDIKVRRAILPALPKFFLADSMCKQIGRSADFLNAVMRHALNHFEDSVTVLGSINLLLSLRSYLKAAALEDNLLRFAGKDKERLQEAKRMGIKWADRKKATQCSGPGCDKAETRPGEFQTCGGCKLAVYCGRAGQASGSEMDGQKIPSKEQAELLSAPTQQALKKILQDSQSKDAITRLWAFDRFTKVFKKFIRPEPAESTMHAAAKLLEKGFLKPIAEGLKECVADPWKLMVGGDSPDDSDVLLIHSEACIKALECLALDSRTVRYILQEFPSLPAVLKALFLEKMTPAEKTVCPVDIKVRRAILPALPKFFLADSMCKQIGRSADFLNAVMRHALNHFEDSVTVLGSINLLLSLRSYLKAAALEDNLLRFAGKVLAESSDTMFIKFTISMLHGVEHDRLLPKGYLLKPLATNSALRSAALALVLCPEQLDEDEYFLIVLLARALEYGTSAALAEDRCSPPGLGIIEDMERLANADSFARNRAHELRTLLAKGFPEDGDFTVRFLRPKASEGAPGKHILQEAEKMGIKMADRKKATRCSGPGCDKVETRPREFQTCGGCKLAVYCGRDCQRRAWKAGHKETCQKTG
ncbi:hypothetical protein KFL_001090180 [Klebsormidium nitens]|uniref:MYND-type domain-containing protein n=1 Tax=Klebsormidium nitens TaxID=105231 RepID=A0A1Y1I0Q5_KLENI|nr:hypothetical protein KFL_001090180 [Klebsormidium nitens]|eukprot:GAQ82367.1 hypothetical protein KFL_001090180 [Klebsormidium nitens]